MNNRVIVFAAVIASVAIVALGWFLGVAPRLADAATAEAERQSVVSQNEGLEVQLAQLQKEFEQIDELRAEVGELRASIPATADYAGFVSELNGLAASTGVGVARLSVGDASWYPSAQAPTAETDGPTAPPEGVASAAAAPTEGAAGPVQVPIDTSLVNGSNFVAIPVTIELTADYDQAVSLMGALQAEKRLFLVTGFAYGGAANPRIDGLLYVLLGKE